ncbi:MAG: class I SAM-dependent methyltransferase [Spirochaetia bacterium]
MSGKVVKPTAQEIIVCPACASRESVACAGPAPGFDCVIEARTFTQPDYVILECAQCGLLYRTPTLTPEVLSDYYKRVDYRKWEIPGFFPNERAVHAQLRQLPRGARILDFGCSSGRLLAPLVKDYQCHGYEINMPAATAAAAKGIKMLPSDALERPLETFDAVVTVDVFEHLSAPLELLRK